MVIVTPFPAPRLHLGDFGLHLTNVPSLLEATMSKSTHVPSPHPTCQPARERCDFTLSRRSGENSAFLWSSSSTSTPTAHTPVQVFIIHLTFEQHKLELRGSINRRIFFNKCSRPVRDTGFPFADSIDCRLKTVFSHSPPQIPSAESHIVLFSICSGLNLQVRKAHGIVKKVMCGLSTTPWLLPLTRCLRVNCILYVLLP